MNSLLYSGIAEPATTFFPPSSWTFNPEYTLPEYDIEEARRLFEETGITELIAKVPTKQYNPIYYQAIEVMAAELDKAGVTLQIIPMEIGRWLEVAVPEPQEDFAFWGFLSVRLPDPDHFLGSTILNIPNYSGYYNEQVQGCLREIGFSSSSRDVREAVYDAMQSILVEEIPIVPLLWVPRYNACHSYVNGFSSPYSIEWLYLEKTWLNR